MGLAVNIPAIEARQALIMAQGIAIAFGSPELTQQTIQLATGDAALAWKVRMQMQHERGGA
jgi:hypothetical protein